MRAAREPLARELREVAPRGHGRHPEAGLDLGHRHGPGLAQEVEDRRAACHREHVVRS
jgi:hypothetical protein